MKKVIAFILVLSIIMGIYLYGTNNTYDFFVHLESISSVADDLPRLQTLGDIWNDDAFYPRENGMVYFYPYESLNDSAGIHHVNAFVLVSDNADWGMFEVIKQIINGFSLASGKVLYTMQFLGRYLIGFFELVFKLLPTNGIVPRT